MTAGTYATYNGITNIMTITLLNSKQLTSTVNSIEKNNSTDALKSVLTSTIYNYLVMGSKPSTLNMLLSSVTSNLEVTLGDTTKSIGAFLRLHLPLTLNKDEKGAIVKDKEGSPFKYCAKTGAKRLKALGLTFEVKGQFDMLLAGLETLYTKEVKSPSVKATFRLAKFDTELVNPNNASPDQLAENIKTIEAYLQLNKSVLASKLLGTKAPKSIDTTKATAATI